METIYTGKRNDNVRDHNCKATEIPAAKYIRFDKPKEYKETKIEINE